MRLYRGTTDTTDTEVWSHSDEDLSTRIHGLVEVTGWRKWLAWLNRPRISIAAILAWCAIVYGVTLLLGLR